MVANLIFEYSAWWIPLCLLMGAIYAAILYRNVKVPWSQSTSYVMAGTRFLLVSLIGILLISPFLNQTENTFEKPLVVIAMDNSQSMAMIDDSTNLQALSSTVLGIGTELEQTGYNVVYRDLVNKNIEPSENILFDQPQTDLAKLLKDIQNDFDRVQGSKCRTDLS